MSDKKTVCPEQHELSAFADGDLQNGERSCIKQHLKQCSDCQQVVDELVQLSGGLAQLVDCPPPRDLWPEIESQLPARLPAPAAPLQPLLRRLRWLWAPGAVAAAAAALVLVFVDRPLDKPGADVEQALVAIVQAESTYVQAIAELERATQSSAGSETGSEIDEEVRSALRSGLKEMDQTIEICRLALEKAPHDVESYELLMAAYQRKVDLMTSMLRAP